MERFVDASVTLETKLVDCCIHGGVAFTNTRAQQTKCDACGAPRFKTNGKPAKLVTYWSLTSWLAHVLSDPITGKSMMENMAAARKAVDKVADGVHDYPHSLNFRLYRDAGLLDHGPFVPANCGIDGFQFFRQNGFEGWPVTVTPLSPSPDERTRTKYPLLLVVTPGPRQPADLESLLHPIAAELSELAKGFPGLIVANLPFPVVFRAGVLNITSDQPGGDQLCQLTGVSSYIYNRFRLFYGIYAPASSHVFFPPKDLSGKSLLKVLDYIAPRRTAARIGVSAAEVENARAKSTWLAHQTRLQKKSGVKGYSLFFAPGPAKHTAHTHRKHLCTMRPTAAPYDITHLMLLNVVPHLWQLFAGLELVNNKRDEEYFLTKATVALIGRDLREARRTVPLARARFLRNIDIH